MGSEMCIRDSFTIALTVAMNWLLFMFVFTTIPDKKIPMRTRSIGSLTGALALAVLLNLATVLISIFSGSPTAALFGPIIAIMLSMNLFIRILLMVAAWMGTSHDDGVFAKVPVGKPVQAQQKDDDIDLTSSLLAVLTAIGLIFLTLFGLKRFEERG